MAVKQFKLPDVGEGLTEGEIVKWMVAPGDDVTVNQNLVEIETAKSAVELPSPWAGVVREVLVEEGTTVDVGAPIVTIDVGGAADGDAGPGGTAGQQDAPPGPPPGPQTAHEIAPNPPAEGAVEPGVIGGPASGGRTAVLVGYGPKQTVAKRRPRRETPAPPAAPAAASAPAAPVAPVAPAAPASSTTAPDPGSGARVAVLAKPPVRKLAKDLGVDLRTVVASGPNGSITRADVEAVAANGTSVVLGATTAPAVAAAAPAPVVPYVPPAGGGRPDAVPAAGWVPELSFANPAREARIPVRGVRKHTAAAMVASAFTAPHVTEFVTVDATATMDLVKRLRAQPEFAEVKVSPLLLVAKAVLLALRRTPILNATWDEPAQEIVVRGYVNLGIAAATSRGLVVPNVKGADELSLTGLAHALAGLTATAREGRTPPGDMQHGTFTITNVGAFGVDSGTPILNPGEAGILAVGSIRPQPWVHEGAVVPRMVTTLGVSFDHRIVDGEQGSRFLRDVADFLEDPQTRLFAWT